MIETNNIEDIEKMTFTQWSLQTEIVTPMAAWAFQNMIANHWRGVAKGMKAEWAQEVCWGKDRLREKIEFLQEENNKLKRKLKNSQSDNDKLADQLIESESM